MICVVRPPTELASWRFDVLATSLAEANALAAAVRRVAEARRLHLTCKGTDTYGEVDGFWPVLIEWFGSRHRSGTAAWVVWCAIAADLAAAAAQ